jgi:hypothetical protein
VVEKGDHSSVPLAKYLVDTLLNYGLHHEQACNHGFLLRLPAGSPDLYVQIPARSHLLLLALAQRLQIGIYVFSSRSKSLVFEPHAPTYSIGLFHNVDSYHGVGEYLVLAATTRPVVLAEAPPPLPPAPQYTTSIPAAVYRTEERKVERKRKRGEEDGGLTEDDAARHFKRSW